MVQQVGRLPFGENMEVRLPYVENFAISCSGTTGLTTTQYTYKAGNMYDPRVEVGGKQPMQYDTLATLFTRYYVHDVECRLTFSNPLYDGMWVGYRVRSGLNTVLTSGQNIDYIQQMDNSELAPLNNTGSQATVFRFKFSLAHFNGVLDALQAQATGLFDGSTNPSFAAVPLIEPYALHTVSGEDSTVRCNIEIIYHARCSDRKTVPES